MPDPEQQAPKQKQASREARLSAVFLRSTEEKERRKIRSLSVERVDQRHTEGLIGAVVTVQRVGVVFGAQ